MCMGSVSAQASYTDRRVKNNAANRTGQRSCLGAFGSTPVLQDQEELLLKHAQPCRCLSKLIGPRYEDTGDSASLPDGCIRSYLLA